LLTRMLEELTDLNKERLARLIPAFLKRSAGRNAKRYSNPRDSIGLEVIPDDLARS
jgi:hypothetical protein